MSFVPFFFFKYIINNEIMLTILTLVFSNQVPPKWKNGLASVKVITKMNVQKHTHIHAYSSYGIL